MDGVILMFIIFPALIGVCMFTYQIVTGEGGTKGITQPYITKRGVRHTAKKSREHHIV